MNNINLEFKPSKFSAQPIYHPKKNNKVWYETEIDEKDDTNHYYLHLRKYTQWGKICGTDFECEIEQLLSERNTQIEYLKQIALDRINHELSY